MAFVSFTSVHEASRAMQEFLFDRDAALPDDVREQLKALVGPAASPVNAVVEGAEILYARRDELSAPAWELGAGLALIAEQFAFMDMAVSGRGSKMALAFMRDANVKKPVGVEYPAKADDPKIKERYAKKEDVVTLEEEQEPFQLEG